MVEVIHVRVCKGNRPIEVAEKYLKDIKKKAKKKFKNKKVIVTFDDVSIEKVFLED